MQNILVIDLEDTATKNHEEEKGALESYVTQLKRKYHRYAKSAFESHWPQILAKFIKLGYVIHKPKRTRKETDYFARLAMAGYENLTSQSTHLHTCSSSGLEVGQNYDDCFNMNITIKEEISDIFLPHNNNGCAQIILIEGAPGIGKTRLMTHIGLCWADGKIFDDKVVLLFPLRELNEKIVSIEDMFSYACEDKYKAIKCSEHFKSNGGQDLVILLDGLDENLEAMHEDNFFYKTLIKDNTFDKACIVITSRPHATVQLQQYASHRVEIVGFTDERRHEFVQENLKENAEDFEKLLQKRHVIDTLCYIPLNMSIMLFLFLEKHRLKDDYCLPDTQTELIHQAVMMTIRRNLEKLGATGQIKDLKDLPEPYKEILNCLGMLAYDALNNNNLIFTENKIKEFCPVKGDVQVQKAVTNGLGLIQKATFFADVSSNTDSLSNFAHFSIQEFLAAWHFAFSYHYCFYPLPLKCKCLQFLSQLNVLNANFWKGDYMNMWSFYIGLTKGEDSVFKHFLSGHYICCSCCCKQGKNYSISKTIVNNKIKSLLLYFFLQEAPDNEIVQLLSVVFTQNCLDVSGQAVNLKKKKDLDLLAYILSRPHSTRLWDKVILSSCEIDDGSFEVLHNILIRNDKSPKIKALLLSDNKLNSCGNAIISLVCHQEIQHLNVSRNKLNLLNLDDNYIKKCATFLETLNISDNKLNDETTMKLFEVLKYFEKLRVLNLNNNDIEADKEKIDALGLALCCCNSLEELEIYGNMIEEEALSIFKVINNIRGSTSYVRYYRLNSKASKFLKVLEYCNKMVYPPDTCALWNKIIQSTVVDVSCNCLKNDDGCTLGHNLHLLVNLKILNVTENNISDEATKSLSTGILFTPNLEEFRYDEKSFNKVNNMVFKMIHRLRNTTTNAFECAPPEIEALVFILNCINDNEEKVQSSDIVSTIGLITELNLSLNKSDYKLTSADIKELCAVLRWFKQLGVLDVTYNDITVEAKEPITKAMIQIHTLNHIELIGNPISYDKLSVDVFDNIRCLHEKEIESIIINQSNSYRMESIIYIMECFKKIKDLKCFKLFYGITTVIIDLESGNCGAKFLEHQYLDLLPCLNHLKIIHGASITDDGMSQLSKYLSHNRTLTTLDLSYCDLKNLEVENEHPNMVLKVLKLNHSNITDKVLDNLLLKFTNLNQLEIEGTCFGDEGITNLHNTLLNTENGQPIVMITALNLANNQLTENSATKIIKIIQKCKVEDLNISDNCLQSILKCFENCENWTLKILNISANNRQTDNAVEFVENLCHLLMSCGSLLILNISNNSIDDKAIDKIFYSLLKYSHLAELICSENPAENEIQLAFDFVTLCTKQWNLQLNLKEKPIAALTLMSYMSYSSISSNEYAKILAGILHEVISIDLSYNGMEIDERIICLLEICNRLERLNLQNNNITSESFKYLATGFLFARRLKLSNICLSGNPCMDNQNNLLVLKIIEKLHYNTSDIYECPLAEFQPFLTVLELVDSVNERGNCVRDAIPYIKQLNVSSKQISDSYSQCLQNTDQKLQSHHVKDLCKYLKYFPYLKTIDMTGNIEEDAKDDLIALLKQSYRHIQLNPNPILNTLSKFLFGRR